MATLINDNAPTPDANPPGTTPYTLNSAAADLLGQQGADAANSLYAAPNVNPQIASAAVNDLFQSFQGATQADATAQAQGITAQGDAAEAQQYLLAGGVADQNARLARVSSNIQSSQEDRKILKTIGGQQSDIAGANLGGASGTTGIFLQRDSAQQGALAKALIGVQGEITAGGFEQQGDAARAEADAANAASGAASTLAGQAASTGAALRTNALNNAMSLIDTAGDGSGGSGGSGSGAAGKSTSVNGAYGGVSVADAAFNAVAMGYKKTALGWIFEGNGRGVGSGPGGIEISDEGQQAARAYMNDPNPPPVHGGGLRIGNAGANGLGDTTDFGRNNQAGAGG